MAEHNMSNLYDNLPDNSHKPRGDVKPPQTTEAKRAEKVVSGKVKTKKNDVRKFTDMFFMEDASNIGSYIINDVLVPTIKKALYDILVGSLDMSLFGGRGNSGRRPTADKVSYRTDYNSVSRRDERTYSSTRTASGYSYDDVIVETRGEAEAVLARMDEIMEEYEVVRVADLYDLVGITGEYTDNKYGWTNIRNAEIERVRDGYRIKMPRALHISRQ